MWPVPSTENLAGDVLDELRVNWCRNCLDTFLGSLKRSPYILLRLFLGLGLLPLEVRDPKDRSDRLPPPVILPLRLLPLLLLRIGRLIILNLEPEIPLPLRNPGGALIMRLPVLDVLPIDVPHSEGLDGDGADATLLAPDEPLLDVMT